MTRSRKAVRVDYDIVIEGATNKDAAWYYPEPKEAAKQIKGYTAFWRGVTIGQ